MKTINKKSFNLSIGEIRRVRNAKNLGFSIITNFGCKNNCWYCVWKNFHKLKNIRTTFEGTDWKKLSKLIKWYPGKKVNVSGGGDPLYNYKNNIKWWAKLLKIVKANNKLLDIHTRELIFEKSFLSNINKLVISFDDLDKIKKQLTRYSQGDIKIRLTKVITKKTKLEELVDIVNFSQKYDFQITFKELYGFDDNDNFAKLKNKLKKLYNFEKKKIKFLEHKDYNIYYLTNNKIYDKFIS